MNGFLLLLRNLPSSRVCSSAHCRVTSHMSGCYLKYRHASSRRTCLEAGQLSANCIQLRGNWRWWEYERVLPDTWYENLNETLSSLDMLWVSIFTYWKDRSEESNTRTKLDANSWFISKNSGSFVGSISNAATTWLGYSCRAFWRHWETAKWMDQ